MSQRCYFSPCKLNMPPLNISVVMYQWWLCTEHQDNIKTDLVLFLLVQGGVLGQEQKHIRYSFDIFLPAWTEALARTALKIYIPKEDSGSSHTHTHTQINQYPRADFSEWFLHHFSLSCRILSGQRKDLSGFYFCSSEALTERHKPL